MIAAEDDGEGVCGEGVGDFAVDGGVGELKGVGRTVGVSEVDTLSTAKG